MRIPKTKLAELRAEINELKMLKKDIDDVDYKNVPISEFDEYRDNCNSEIKV